jgi:hypothetical protein
MNFSIFNNFMIILILKINTLRDLYLVSKIETKSSCKLGAETRVDKGIISWLENDYHYEGACVHGCSTRSVS